MHAPPDSPVDQPGPPSVVAAALARDRLGVPALVFFILSAAAPFTVIAGVIGTSYGVTGITGIPVAFIAMALLIALFAVGYTAMARHIRNAGAFYSYVAHGLGRTPAVAVSLVALLAYNALQIALYGAFGVFTSTLVDAHTPITLSWWVCALAGWAIVAVLGQLRVDLNGRVLAVLIGLEIAVILAFSIADVAHPAAGGVDYGALSPGNLFTSGVGALLVIAVLGYVGFEGGAVYSEEVRNPRRTVPLATFIAVGLIGAVYTFSSWAMTVPTGTTGTDGIAAFSAANGPETVFVFADRFLGAAWAETGRVLFITSLFAAMLSFHNTVARYFFALGREGVLPRGLGRTSASTGAPIIGSAVQSVLALAVIVLYAVTGWDPLVQLFFWGGTAGALGVLALLTVTSLAVATYFFLNAGKEKMWRGLLAPIAAFVALAGTVVLALVNYDKLLGVAPDDPLRWLIPAAYVVVAAIGAVWAWILGLRRPEVYAAIGLGADSVTRPALDVEISDVVDLRGRRV